MEEIVNQEIRQSAEEVFRVMAERETPENVARIRDAFEFAARAHAGQLRNSGVEFITHPIAVAKIVAEELELDANTVIAAFLHDVVEDTEYTIDDIRERFGDDVAFIVNVVTKRKKDHYESSKQIDNFRQILDSVGYDVRALLLKLSDRLHNMRTLDGMKPDKQMKIAGETDFFYAPLANRLGLYYVKSDLENLSFRYRCPREFALLEAQLEADKERTAGTVRKFCDEILEILHEKHVNARIEVRYRKPYSIWKCMTANGIDFGHVDFKHYIRVIYTPYADEWTEKDTSLFIYSKLTSKFKERPGSVSNYIDNPKDNGYQSFHVKLLNHSGVWEELHISSERMIRNSRLGCIVDRSGGTSQLWIERFRQVLQEIATDGNATDFMEGLSTSLYSEDIVAFTPKGKGIILPKGATAIDFAYEIHSHVGEHAQYARINGELCSIRTELRRGDCVEIGVDPGVEPNQSWLESAVTFKAKRHIASYLKKSQQLAFDRCPLCKPLPGDEVIGFRNGDGRITLHSRHCTDAIRRASEDGDSIVSVNFEENERLLYPVKVHMVAIDRYHLLRDVIDCITEQHNLSIDSLETASVDKIVDADIVFSVHSAQELDSVTAHLSAIQGTDEVQVC